ncbi:MULTISPECIES: YHYH domain-containing protein [Pseudomonadaceae]|uniref:YHYH domain-containing protein n=1 Tax=Pseudomonadaceae TaxID=135621 RepID=UPI00292892F0|nr:YHYH domain-containing protein [Pseudomonas sp. zfem003]MDU9394918.1 YHYH domain-containing protein [Pseudomonas sp. zfem003]HEN8704371.1 YHYH domain-containing protein [Pseudomonas putida]
MASGALGLLLLPRPSSGAGVASCGSVIAIATVIALFSDAAIAHSGGTDSKGCHANHSTGEYHCH